MQKCSFKSSFFRHEIIKLPDKIIMENCLFISKSIKFNLSPIFNHWFTFSSDSHNYETSSSSKGLLKVKTVNTKKYGREAMTNNAVSSWNNIQKSFSSHVPTLRPFFIFYIEIFTSEILSKILFK